MKRFEMLIICSAILVLSACQSEKSKQAALNELNLKQYLGNSLKINTDSLNTRLVLIDYIGCKPCVNKYLNFFTLVADSSALSFTFIYPLSIQNEVEKYYMPSHNHLVHIDSNNKLFRQNIIVEGLTIYDFQKGKLQSIKTIDIFQNTQEQMHTFWFE